MINALLVVIFSICLYFGLREVFNGSIILPQSFALGPLTFRYYGLLIAAATGAAYWLAERRRAAYGISARESEGLIVMLLAGGFVGARLYHVVSEFSYYLEHPLLIGAVWRGGLSIFGAMLGGVAVITFYYYYLNRHNKPHKKQIVSTILNALDWLAPSLVIGQIIGRFGNLFNYEAYGSPAFLPWKMFIPAEFRISPFENVNFYHPYFLYEAILNVIILIILLYLSPKLRGGRLFFIWLILYNMVRFFLEALRIDSVLIYGFRMNMIVAAALVLIGMAGYNYLNEQKKSHIG